MSFYDGVLKNKDEDLQGLKDLKGKILVDIGFMQEQREGGLTIDYKDENEIKRIVLGFNELGMWIAWQGIKGKVNPEDVLKEKIKKVVESDVLVWDNIKIIDDPLKRCFRFKAGIKEVLTLTVSEIKLLPEFAKKYFHMRCEERDEKAKEDLISFLYEYAY